MKPKILASICEAVDNYLTGRISRRFYSYQAAVMGEFLPDHQRKYNPFLLETETELKTVNLSNIISIASSTLLGIGITTDDKARIVTGLMFLLASEGARGITMYSDRKRRKQVERSVEDTIKEIEENLQGEKIKW